jgi:hypothetical protein
MTGAAQTPMTGMAAAASNAAFLIVIPSDSCRSVLSRAAAFVHSADFTHAERASAALAQAAHAYGISVLGLAPDGNLGLTWKVIADRVNYSGRKAAFTVTRLGIAWRMLNASSAQLMAVRRERRPIRDAA